MQMHEPDIVEDAVAGAVAVRFIAVRVRDHCFRTNLPSARPSRHPAAGFTTPPRRSVPPATAFATLAGVAPWPHSRLRQVMGIPAPKAVLHDVTCM